MIIKLWILCFVKGNLNQIKYSLGYFFINETNLRSPSDWEKVWHHESHSRCREKLVKHLYWACEKDIYRLSRRSSPTSQIEMKSGIYYASCAIFFKVQ